MIFYVESKGILRPCRESRRSFQQHSFGDWIESWFIFITEWGQNMPAGGITSSPVYVTVSCWRWFNHMSTPTAVPKVKQHFATVTFLSVSPFLKGHDKIFLPHSAWTRDIKPTGQNNGRVVGKIQSSCHLFHFSRPSCGMFDVKY